jgi:predicted XRE-type DNA-binding protein
MYCTVSKKPATGLKNRTSEPSNRDYRKSTRLSARRRDMLRNERGVGHVTTGNVLDDLGFDEQTSLELKLKYQIYEGILVLVAKQNYTPRDLEVLFDVPQPRVSELLRGKLNTISVKKLLWYMGRLGGSANIKVQEVA